MKAIRLLELLVIALFVIIGGYLIGDNYNLLLPEAISIQAVEFDRLFRFVMTLAGIVFLVVVLGLVYVVIRFRRRPGDETDAKPIEDNVTLEVLWTLVPLIMVTAISLYSYSILRNFDISYFALSSWLRGPTTPGEALAPPGGKVDETVQVFGQQFIWTFQYPKYNITTTTMHVPVNKVILARITSKDVIHSFWVPDLRIKKDANPDLWNELIFTPDITGTFSIICAELCGVGHYEMRSQLVVESESAFKDWVAQQQAQAASSASGVPSVSQGQSIFHSTCSSCHNLTNERKVGPGLAGLFNKPQLPNGQPVNDQNLADWIHTGGSGLPGYPAMPALPEVKGQMLQDLIAFLKVAT